MKRRKKKKLQEGRQGVADEEQDQTNNGSDDEWTEEEDETMTDRDDREYKDQEEIEILEDKEITEAYDGSTEAAASAAAFGAASPGPQSISPKLDYDLIPEPGRSTYFKHDRDDSAPEDEESRDVADRGMEAEWAEVETDNGTGGKEREIGTELKAPSNLAVETMVQNVRKIVIQTLERGMEELGEYLLQHVFDNDIGKVFSKNPYKGTSFSELARHPQMPLSRQRLAEAVRAAAFGREMEEIGVPRGALSFTHKIHIASIKDRAKRKTIVLKAHDQGWTVETTKKEVQKLVGLASSEDQRLGRSLLRQMGELVKLSKDGDTKSFLQDKGRLRAALPRTERLQMIGSSEEIRKYLKESVNMLETLEEDLVDIELEARGAVEESSSERSEEGDSQQKR